jgi:uncharacterized OB-fold protein
MQARPKPLPKPTPETQPFWDGARDGRLLIMHCNACARDYFYPRPYCPFCFSQDTSWKQASGKAKLHTYMIIHRAAPGFEGEAPYVVGVVQLDEGPRMMTNIVGIEPNPANLTVDMPLEVSFDKANDEITLPKFRPAS